MSKKIGIIGASGMVGQELLKLLITNGHIDIKICASDSKVSNEMVINGHKMIMDKLDFSFFDTLDVAFFCADNTISKNWIPYAVDHNIFVIDNSSYFRLNKDVPLVIPPINGNLIKFSKSKLISNPNCSTAILCMLLYPLSKLSKIKRIDVSTYQAVSGAGKIALNALDSQIKKHIDETIVESIHPFKSKIFNNCFSHDSEIDLESGYNGEEIKIIQETKKIIEDTDDDIEISATCIRIPIERVHSESVKIMFDTEVIEDDIYKILKSFEGVKVIDDRKNNKFPEPIDACNTNDVLIGRIRKDYFDKSGKTYHMFICGDQLLRGASFNAFEIYKHWLA